jgi:hypothetical protein
VSTKLNLASKPFSNRSLPWAVAAVVIVISLVSLVFIVKNTREANSHATAVQNDINALGQQEQALRKQADAVKSSFTPDQLQTLTSAHILVDRKSDCLLIWNQPFPETHALNASLCAA